MRRSEHSASPAEPVLERVGSRSSRPRLLLVLAALTIGVAIAKPWEGLPRAPVAAVARVPAATTAPSQTPTPTPTIDPTIEAASSKMICNAPPDWRLVSMETDIFGDSRTMFGADAVQASGPTDRHIPTVELHATKLFGMGVCRPNPGGLRVADLSFNQVTIWVANATGRMVSVANPRILNQALYRLGEAYFGPPKASTAWTPGRYVIEISDATPSGASLWLALYFLAA